MNTEAFHTIDDSNAASDIEIRFGDSLGEKIYFDRSEASFHVSDDLRIENSLQVAESMSGRSLSVMQDAGIAVVPTDARFHIKGGGVGQKFRYETSQSEYSLRIGGGFTGAADEVALTAGAGVESHLADTTSPAWAFNFSGLSDYAAIAHGANNGQGNAVTWTQYFRIDAAGDVGIGLGSSDAETKLEVGGTMSGRFLTISNLKNCDTLDTDEDGVLSCGTDSEGSGGAPDTAAFTDGDPAAWNGDNDTTELFDDGTKPNIVTDATTSTVLVTVNIEGNASNTAADSNLAARIVATTDGSTPDCSTSGQVGEDMVSNFTTTTAQYWANIKGTFLHTPGVAGTIKYTVCSSSAGANTMSDTATSINVTLVELGG